MGRGGASQGKACYRGKWGRVGKGAGQARGVQQPRTRALACGAHTGEVVGGRVVEGRVVGGRVGRRQGRRAQELEPRHLRK